MICHVDSAAISIGTLPVALHLTICRRSISGEFVYSLLCVTVKLETTKCGTTIGTSETFLKMR
jgi:hypothetical protein